ncbi:ABC transporter ATP-binding protein [Lachnospiraceae bacterium LCP25S3_G4]
MIEFKNVSKVYPGNKVAVENINLKFNKGEFICLIGTSGSGKTTCMRMINRMNIPSKGVVEIDGRDISKMDEVNLRRRIGYVIQQIGLMPHMTIYDNIIMVPKLLKWSKDKMDQVARDLLHKADLPDSYLDYYPSELSGGQQQRVGVLRALAADQDIILMDEPFGALDPITRETLQKLVKKLQKEMGKTIIFVTHDMDEALQLSDRMVVMDQGKVIQFDTPENILINPVNEFVRNMLGEERISQAKFDYESVERMMIRNPYSIGEERAVSEAVKMMHENRVDTLFVVDDHNILKGHIDIFAVDRQKAAGKMVRDFLKEATFVYSDTKIRDVIYYINDLGCRNMPVVDKEQHLLGLVTRATVVDVIYDGLWKDYQPDEENTQIDDTSESRLLDESSKEEGDQ